MTLNKDYPDAEKFRAELESELAHENNWAEQEQHRQRMREHWAHQEKITQPWVFIAVAIVAALFGGLLVKFMGI